MSTNGEHSLADKTGLMPGSTQGIGLAVARPLAATIAVHGLASPLQADATGADVLASGAPEAWFVGADLRTPGGPAAMTAAVAEWHDLDNVIKMPVGRRRWRSPPLARTPGTPY